jgi:hypothetical protein
MAQEDDVFAFIPDGGRTLLAPLLEDAPTEEATAILTDEKSREEWLAYLQERSNELPGLGELDEHQLLTLADYLFFNMPLAVERMPADPGSAEWGGVLPHDGRDLTLNECQFCHIITVVVTQDRPMSQWLGTMNKPSHVEIPLSEKEREALASYLVLNAGIPEDLVPEELRAGGASY